MLLRFFVKKLVLSYPSPLLLFSLLFPPRFPPSPHANTQRMKDSWQRSSGYATFSPFIHLSFGVISLKIRSTVSRFTSPPFPFFLFPLSRCHLWSISLQFTLWFFLILFHFGVVFTESNIVFCTRFFPPLFPPFFFSGQFDIFSWFVFPEAWFSPFELACPLQERKEMSLFFLFSPSFFSPQEKFPQRDFALSVGLSNGSPGSSRARVSHANPNKKMSVFLATARFTLGAFFIC